MLAGAAVVQMWIAGDGSWRRLVQKSLDLLVVHIPLGQHALRDRKLGLLGQRVVALRTETKEY